MVAWLPKVEHLSVALLCLCIICPLAVTPPAMAGEAVPAAEANSPFTARQSGLSWTITPLSGTESPSDFYAYAGFLSKNPLVQPETSLIFFYRYGAEGPLTLFIIHGPPARGVLQTTANLSFDGLPATAFILLKDDPDDYYWLSPPSGQMSWQWSAGSTDGAVIGGLVGEFTLAIYPLFGTGITHWALVTGDLANPQYIVLPSLSEPLFLRVSIPDPVASFRYQPTEPSMGEPVSFDASASRSSMGPIVKYKWSFSSNSETRSTSPQITYVFQTAGDQTVTLEVEDQLGRATATTRTVHVRDDPVQVTRKIKTFLPNSQTLPGYVLNVELLIEVDAPVNGLGIEETPPAGWHLEPLDSGRAQFNAVTSAWLYLETLPAGAQLQITYQIDVPKSAVLGAYHFAGRVLSSAPQVNSAIGGDSDVEVIGALPIEIAISRLNDRGEIDLTLSNMIGFAQILQAAALWQQDQPVPGTNGRHIDLSTMVRLVAYWLTDTPVDQPLPAGSG
jgi:hypothetical protein